MENPLSLQTQVGKFSRPANRSIFSADSCQPLVNLNHFRLLRVVGKGAFGKVRIVERKDNGDQFALKYIRKDEGTHSPSIYLLEAVVTCWL